MELGDDDVITRLAFIGIVDVIEVIPFVAIVDVVVALVIGWVDSYVG